ncbi:MAG: diacylglycerol kinase family protein, partial [Desulfobacterales bacterium]
MYTASQDRIANRWALREWGAAPIAVRASGAGEIMQVSSHTGLKRSAGRARAAADAVCASLAGGWKPWRLGVISNPQSGRNRRQMAAIRGFLAGQGQIAQREVLDAADVAAALAAFAREGIDLVALNSGDGTVQAALTTLFNERPYGEALPLLALL